MFIKPWSIAGESACDDFSEAFFWAMERWKCAVFVHNRRRHVVLRVIYESLLRGSPLDIVCSNRTTVVTPELDATLGSEK